MLKDRIPACFGLAAPAMVLTSTAVELLDVIAKEASRVLLVGCGFGHLGWEIKMRTDAEVVGVEKNSLAANAARARLDEVWEGDVEKEALPFTPGTFEYIILDGYLEQCVSPLETLRYLRGFLKHGGGLLVAAHNVRNCCPMSRRGSHLAKSIP